MNPAPSNQPLPERASAQHTARAAYSPAVREADKEVLSLALMDARNYTLALFEAFEPLATSGYVVAADNEVPQAWPRRCPCLKMRTPCFRRHMTQ
jgi:hypothetical protein